MKRFPRRLTKRWWFWLLIPISLILLLSLYLAVRIVIAGFQFPTPQLVFVLGGGSQRETFAAIFANAHPDLKILVSSGTDQAEKIFREAGVRNPVLLDCRATDTVTNFTTVAQDLERLGVKHVYLIASPQHLSRAKAIAFIVFGSRGITTTPVETTFDDLPQDPRRTYRDFGRALLWLFTGKTGEKFNGRDRDLACRYPGYMRGIPQNW
ncbi:MAG: YdcF family protein [Tildeniella nuda ZEHNDER 1965/U140]|jgi:uncharacterized SAM-binding protein YcdF (DUF218 family)|nr:YdcF family protein [Tildeniella nuda ZEHNDER 1965/U140]